ncbi:hypothetical protein RDWZM_008824 [Blomia tropicalis]|uniref:Calpain catalytic domain-containing protein n=1 Tax=Blomia tropicalis TaxID=40697 RepID=A0A9Q0M566_BLOTA|nr:hypothetical protein RDWZM_008824 [Blomia tropicalis]
MSFSDITHTLPLEPIDTITNSNDHLKPISYLDINQNYFHSNYQHIKEDNIIQQRVASFNWNSHINSCANSTQSVVTAINDQPDIVIGDELLLDDSQTIRIGSEYLEKFVNHWKQFSNCILIRPNPFSSDIVQGLLGNCWFLSALALIAERSELLEKILLTTSQEFEKTKRATIRLFKQGRWHSVIVDNLLPVNKFGKLIFSQAKREQLFVPLIEKALAKLNGGYEALRGGLTSEGMTTLTGFPCEIVWLPNKQCIDNAHLKNGIVAIEQKEELWIKIVSYFTTGFLIGASCGRCSNTISFTEYRSIGLLEEHAYSVLDVYSKSDLRLIKLRNPWGTMVWKGDWSDTSLTWNDNLRKELIPEGAEEGIFWISFDDFCRYFEMIIVCKTQLGLHEYAFEGAIPGYTNDCLSNWIVYEISIDEQLTQEYYTQTQLTATLYQDKSNEPLAIFLVIYELLNSNTSPVIGSLVGFSICNAQSSVTVECDLRRNHRYLLGAFTFNNWYTEEDTYHPKKYIIRMQSMRQLLIKSFKPNSILLGDMIMHYARSVGSSIHVSPLQ